MVYNSRGFFPLPVRYVDKDGKRIIKYGAAINTIAAPPNLMACFVLFQTQSPV